MSTMRSRLVRYLGLLTVAALAVGMLAGPASAKKLSPKQKAKIAKQLRKEIKKNPKAIKSKSFLKRASLVNFRLPVTLALRTGDVANTAANEAAFRNPNQAIVDLGASLGQREVNLGGKLAGEVVFADSYDGGALGNVKIDINPGPKALTSTSIPLLWNTQVTAAGTRWDSNALIGNLAQNPGVPNAALDALASVAGCGTFNAANMPFGANLAPVIGAPLAAATGIPQPGGLPGYPLHSAADPGGAPEGFLPVTAGIDNPANVVAAKDPGNPMSVGGNPSPFPTGDAPGGFTQPPTTGDTVLRTAPLALTIAQPGTNVNQTGQLPSGNPDGVSGSSNITIGKSGGEANLFGNIPGKAYGIDVTVSLATRIASILRIVDQDSWGRNLIEGEPYPAGVFGCRQVYTGAIQNYIPGVRLKGNLRISPGITSDGSLRIAKATVSSESPARFAVAACLVPKAAFQAPQANYNNPLPTPTGGLTPAGDLPVDTGTYQPTPTADCNSAPDPIVANSAHAPATVDQLAPAVPANGYTVTNSGSAVTVAADLNVTNVALDVLIGDV